MPNLNTESEGGSCTHRRTWRRKNWYQNRSKGN